MALGFQLDVFELAQDNRLVGEGLIIALIGKGWRFVYSGCVVDDDTEKQFLCPALFRVGLKKTYEVAEYLR